MLDKGFNVARTQKPLAAVRDLPPIGNFIPAQFCSQLLHAYTSSEFLPAPHPDVKLFIAPNPAPDLTLIGYRPLPLLRL